MLFEMEYTLMFYVLTSIITCEACNNSWTRSKYTLYGKM
jgi:hypothetical protein